MKASERIIGGVFSLPSWNVVRVTDVIPIRQSKEYMDETCEVVRCVYQGALDQALKTVEFTEDWFYTHAKRFTG